MSTTLLRSGVLPHWELRLHALRRLTRPHHRQHTSTKLHLFLSLLTISNSECSQWRSCTAPRLPELAKHSRQAWTCLSLLQRASKAASPLILGVMQTTSLPLPYISVRSSIHRLIAISASPMQAGDTARRTTRQIAKGSRPEQCNGTRRELRLLAPVRDAEM